MFILDDFSVQLLPLLYEKYTPPEVAATIVLRFKGFTMSLFTVTLPELAIPELEAVNVTPPSVDLYTPSPAASKASLSPVPIRIKGGLLGGIDGSATIAETPSVGMLSVLLVHV